MSDFTSSFWPIYISVITIGGILGCVLLLWISGTTKVASAADNTTGHVWDGDLREMNNPLPRWWVGLFIITVLFAFAYLYLYPGLGSYQGSLKWSQTDQFDREVTKGNEQVAPIYAAFQGKSVHQLAQDPQAMAIGDRLFMNNCAQCHGSDAGGSKSFPNLTDKDWLWGGSPEQIHESITNGRQGIMAPVAEAVGTPEDVRNVAHYVLSLSDSPHDSVRASLGKPKFGVCAACHGADGKGNHALGAPNLTDNIWLHGWGENAIVDRITKGLHNVMPAWASKFTPEQINVLTAYVWGLSNKDAGAAGDAPVAPAAQTAPAAPAIEAAAPAAESAPAAPAADAAAVHVDAGVVKLYFAVGKADVAAEADQALADIVAGAQAGKKVVVSGFVDSTGNAARNEELAKQRAFAVRDKLKALGVAEDAIELKKPEAIDAGADAKARRVEVSLS